ncbi:hypothetical protein V8F20_008881 [Naviculisporaceae sp. PSN 640]
MAPPSRRQILLTTSLLHLLNANVNAQSFVGGDLNTIAPFSLPPDTFTTYTSNSNSDRTFPITGYNLSSPASSSDATGSEIPGWSLAVHLTSGVPLRESKDNTVPKEQYFQATKLSLLPPEGSYAQFDENNWLLCAIVFTGGFKNIGNGDGVNQDGTCGGYLGDDCISALQVAGVQTSTSTGNQTAPAQTTSSSSGHGQGRCQDLVLPQACLGDEGADGVNDNGESDAFDGVGGGTAFEIVPVTKSETNTGALAFFAAGSAPVKNEDDADSIKAAERFVWPILLTWTHFGPGSDGTTETAHDAVSWLSCVQAPETASEAVGDDGKSGGKDSGAGGRLAAKGPTVWAVLVGVMGVGLTALL